MKRDKMTTIRVNSELLDKFKQTVEEKEKNNISKTSLSDIVEKGMKEFINNAIRM